MNQLVSGALAAGYLTVGLFFLRFWKSTHDRLFILFAIAFALLALERIAFVVTHPTTENAIFLYTVRLIAFIIILVAIVDKNRA